MVQRQVSKNSYVLDSSEVVPGMIVVPKSGWTLSDGHGALLRLAPPVMLLSVRPFGRTGLTFNATVLTVAGVLECALYPGDGW